MRPALVPAAMAVGLPVALLQASALAAALSLPVSAVLVLLSVVVAREKRTNAYLADEGARRLGLPPYAGPTPAEVAESRQEVQS